MKVKGAQSKTNTVTSKKRRRADVDISSDELEVTKDIEVVVKALGDGNCLSRSLAIHRYADQE